MPRGIRGSVSWVQTQLSSASTNKVATWNEKPRCHDSLSENPAMLLGTLVWDSETVRFHLLCHWRSNLGALGEAASPGASRPLDPLETSPLGVLGRGPCVH